MNDDFYPGRYLNAIELFLAIRRILVMNKLSGRTDYWGRDLSMKVSGDQLATEMAPNRGGFASYYLMDVRNDLLALADVDLIQEGRRSQGPSGYGDDQEYWLTEAGLAFCEGKTQEEIRYSLRCLLAGDPFTYSFDIDRSDNSL